MRHIWGGHDVLPSPCSRFFFLGGGRVSPVPSGIYAPGQSLLVYIVCTTVMCGRICVLAVLLGVADFNSDGPPISDADRGGGCAVDLRRITVGFLVTLCLTVLLEVAMVVVSMRGSILNVQPRFTMPYIVYTRFRTYIQYSIVRRLDRAFDSRFESV